MWRAAPRRIALLHRGVAVVGELILLNRSHDGISIDPPPAVEPLTDRERQVVRLVAQGLSNGEIAERLYLGERTVRSHVSHILATLHLANRTQLALYALRTGLALLAAS